jgi:hypothetical protein
MISPTGAELCPAQNVARAHNNGQLHTTVADTLGLPGDGERFFDADARFARAAETFSA